MKIKEGIEKRGRPRLLNRKSKTTLNLDVDIKKSANRIAFNRGIYLGELIEELLKKEFKRAPELKNKVSA